VSDALRSVATPLVTIKRTKFTKDARSWSDIVRNAILRASSSACRATWTEARAARAIHPRLRPEPRAHPDFEGVAITFWDERLSTVAAEKALLEADTTRKRRAEVIDAVAARLYPARSTGQAQAYRGGIVSEDIWKRDEVESPCVKICVVHPEARLCTGCLRSIDEITAWSRMSHEARRAVMAELPASGAAEGPARWARGAHGAQGIPEDRRVRA
jgi:predicted Fe-S protein YdhL (DUF1289 family)/RNase H-fold protein (predicted Holliday junction resolvase)